MKFGRLSGTIAIVATASGVALKGFSRLWNDLCNAIEQLTADDLTNGVTGNGKIVLQTAPVFLGTIQLGTPYVAGAPGATGYILIKDSTGTAYKILVST